MKILVTVGTTSGRALGVAEALARRLARPEVEVAVVPMDRVEPGDWAAAEALIVCTSTFGAGGVPTAAAGLLAAIAAGEFVCAGKPVGFVGLGDRSFPRTYNAGWRAFEAALVARGAVPVGEALLFDAADVRAPAEEAARLDARAGAWAEAFLALLGAGSPRLRRPPQGPA